MKLTSFDAFPAKLPFFREMQRFVRRHVPPGARLLDIASSDFRMAFLFGDVDYYGADLDPGLLAQAKARMPEHAAVACDIRELPFAGEFYDIVISTHTLVHLPGREAKLQALSELHRVLKTGGHLAFNIGQPPRLVKELDPWLNARFDKVEKHLSKRWLVVRWERYVSSPVMAQRIGVLIALVALMSPLVAAIDRFGRPTQALYCCLTKHQHSH